MHVLGEGGEIEEGPPHQHMKKKKGEKTPLERLEELRAKRTKTNKERQEAAKLEKLYGRELDELKNPTPEEQPDVPPPMPDMGSLKI